MLRDVDGKEITSARLQAIRWKGTMVKSAIEEDRPCWAGARFPENFLLIGERCCYCGVSREKHRQQEANERRRIAREYALSHTEDEA